MLVQVLFCEIVIDGRVLGDMSGCIGVLLASLFWRIQGRQGAVWSTLRGAAGESGDGAGAFWRG